MTAPAPAQALVLAVAPILVPDPAQVDATQRVPSPARTTARPAVRVLVMEGAKVLVMDAPVHAKAGVARLVKTTVIRNVPIIAKRNAQQIAVEIVDFRVFSTADKGVRILAITPVLIPANRTAQVLAIHPVLDAQQRARMIVQVAAPVAVQEIALVGAGSVAPAVL